MQRTRTARRASIALAVGIGGAVGLRASPAAADASSWVSTAAGPAIVADADDERLVPLLRFDAGIGTSPARSWIFGGGFQLGAHLGQATDLGAGLRLATGPYARGDWGLALDLGAYHRLARVSDGLAGALTLGAPWGVVIAANGTVGTEEAWTLGLVMGLDFARLTAHRTSGQQWWPNPLATRARRGAR